MSISKKIPGQSYRGRLKISTLHSRCVINLAGRLLRVAVVEGRRRPHGQRLRRPGAERRRPARAGRGRGRADHHQAVHQAPRGHGPAHPRHLPGLAVQEARQTGMAILLRCPVCIVDGCGFIIRWC